MNAEQPVLSRKEIAARGYGSLSRRSALLDGALKPNQSCKSVSAALNHNEASPVIKTHIRQLEQSSNPPSLLVKRSPPGASAINIY